MGPVNLYRDLSISIFHQNPYDRKQDDENKKETAQRQFPHRAVEIKIEWPGRSQRFDFREELRRILETEKLGRLFLRKPLGFSVLAAQFYLSYVTDVTDIRGQDQADTARFGRYAYL